jgi:hypothetical protein
MRAFTIKQVVDYGHSRDWKPLSKKAWKDFCGFIDRPPRPKDFQAANDFTDIYFRLTCESPEVRECFASLPQETALRQLHALADNKLERQKQKNDSLIEKYRGRRVWRLAGFDMGDMTTSLYTLNELEDWRNWAAGTFACMKPTVVARCEADGERAVVTIDWSYLFKTVNPDDPAFYNFEELAQHLSEYVSNRRNRQAELN